MIDMTDRTPIVLGDAVILAPGRWRWLRALGWMVALFVAAVAIVALPGLLRMIPAVPSAARQVAGCLTILLIYLAYARVVRIGEGRRASEIAPGPLPRELGIGLLIGLGMFTAVFGLLRIIGVYSLTPGDWSDWPRDILSAGATGFFEEFLLRAIVFRLLMRAFGPWVALAVSALIFGAMHLGNPNATLVAALAIAVEAGLMLASFYLLTGRLWMSVGVHIAWNFAQGPIFGARVSGNVETGSLFTSAPRSGTADLLTGGPFGPEASVVAMLVGLAVFATVMAAVARAKPADRPI